MIRVIPAVPRTSPESAGLPVLDTLFRERARGRNDSGFNSGTAIDPSDAVIVARASPQNHALCTKARRNLDARRQLSAERHVHGSKDLLVS